MNWINIIVPVVSSIVAIICYRLGCKAGYARGHEDGRTFGATELANQINGMQGSLQVKVQDSEDPA